MSFSFQFSLAPSPCFPTEDHDDDNDGVPDAEDDDNEVDEDHAGDLHHDEI